LPRRTKIEAAIAAHNATTADRELGLPPAAGRLLAVMFPRGGSVCQRSLDALAAEGFSRRQLPATLNRLVRLGLLTWESGIGGAPHTFRLNLPPRRQP
jgi:hypothetical protein